MVGCLVLADALFLTVWQLVDPLKKSAQYINNRTSKRLHFPGKSRLLEPRYLRMRTRTLCTSRRSGCAGLTSIIHSLMWWHMMPGLITITCGSDSPTDTRASYSSSVSSWPMRPGASRWHDLNLQTPVTLCSCKLQTAAITTLLAHGPVSSPLKISWLWGIYRLNKLTTADWWECLSTMLQFYASSRLQSLWLLRISKMQLLHSWLSLTSSAAISPWPWSSCQRSPFRHKLCL